MKQLQDSGGGREEKDLLSLTLDGKPHLLLYPLCPSFKSLLIQCFREMNTIYTHRCNIFID